VEHAPGAIVLHNIFGVNEIALRPHECVMDGIHLQRKHRLELMPWLSPFDDGKLIIDLLLVNGVTHTRISDSLHKAPQKIRVR
jgi:hypothetical protein